MSSVQYFASGASGSVLAWTISTHGYLPWLCSLLAAGTAQGATVASAWWWKRKQEDTTAA